VAIERQYAHSTTGSTTTTVDDYAPIPACQKDNFLLFDADLTYADDEGPTSCAPFLPQKRPGTWGFASNETALEMQIVGANRKTTFIITQLTSSTLVLVYTDTGPSVPGVYTSTYQAL
jgi:hypothetical protein